MTGAGRGNGPLIAALTATAAATDALSYLGLGRVFTANMTGNTVLLGLGVATGDLAAASRSATALGSYTAAAVLAGAVTAGYPPGRLVRTGLLLELAVLVAAAGWWLALPGHPAGSRRYGLIALAGAAMGTQSCVVQHLGVPGVATTYITGTLTALSQSIGARLRGPASAGRPTRQAPLTVVLLVYPVAALAAGAAFTAGHGLAALLPVGTLTAAFLRPAAEP